MKSDGFMIGDWILHKDEVRQIDTLTPSNSNLGVTTEYGSGPALWEDIEPLEITPKILLNNGFEQRGVAPIYQWYGDGGVSVTVDYIRSECVVKGMKRQTLFYEIPLLHEMQNAITICNISKVIKF